MPRKLRQLKAELRRAGFSEVTGGGKGSHSKWEHPLAAGPILLAGKDGSDAKAYQEQQVRAAIQEVEHANRREP